MVDSQDVAIRTIAAHVVLEIIITTLIGKKIKMILMLRYTNEII